MDLGVQMRQISKKGFKRSRNRVGDLRFAFYDVK